MPIATAARLCQVALNLIKSAHINVIACPALPILVLHCLGPYFDMALPCHCYANPHVHVKCALPPFKICHCVMDWNLKSHQLEWGWDNNISICSCSGLEFCRHAETFINEKEVNKAENIKHIYSLDGVSSYSLDHGSSVKSSAEESNYGIVGSVPGFVSVERKEKYSTSGTCTRPGGSSIGLNLYPANNETVTSNCPVLPLSSTTAKRCRGSYHLMQNPYCQVEGCNLDLTSAKEYHRRHRICEAHSKSRMVIVAGMERRFCQQCSRFHELSEFDDNKRSCRRKLSDHNARRRRSQPEANHSSSTGTTFFVSWCLSTALCCHFV
ncbi:PREDICTED: squamosa promoter-binding-like protein 3 [Nicotiana attenuata]|uniref:squamosa promoter-binding-like protein 3 n=1 Tax=Nicotiana attenuata TaxID=49451 RepID=UPI000905B80A|nr:PREDICTED: squamosa promoter-binding-like protein 3 [Nicotiana attenuata]